MHLKNKRPMAEGEGGRAMFSEATLRALVKRECRNAGTQLAVAKRWGISPAYLNDFLEGRRGAGAKILAGAGIKKVVAFERIDQKDIEQTDRIDPSRGWFGSSSPDKFQREGAAWDIIAEAIDTYNEWMLDDDYDATTVLRKIIDRLIERRNFYRAPAPTSITTEETET